MFIRQLVTALSIGWLAAVAHAEVGVTNDAIVLGQSAALSGPARFLGEEMRDGALAYFAQINEQGGVNGRKIQLVSLDDGYEPDRAMENTKVLIEKHKVFALFGYVGTPTSNAAMPLFTAAKVPFYAPFTGADSLRTPHNRYIFNVRASYADEAEKIIRHATNLHLSRIAVFYQNDAYGKAGLAGVEQAMQKRGMTITTTATVERNSTEVESAVKKLAEAKPDAVVMVSTYKSSAAFIKRAQQAGVASQFYNVSFVGSRPLAEELGEQAAGVVVSQVVPSPFDQSQAVVREYRKSMAKYQPKSMISFTSMEGFIAAKSMVEGLKRAGESLTRERLIAALEQGEPVHAGEFKVAFSATSHSPSRFVDLTVMQRDGTFRN
ncbi:ABC-type branched-subunit amino acid transport system substrate-binding protein [Chitinivorax tropicus]|uniref:ABC-type branched-subunit amino acid transport system substrate-binding protein n=1 Tax=Chitinivorax tropicus TaxID=714531 RepID=A0A840MKS7_9PROT|nr:ABC transporter substrate-binding protein [Chitinivorax tropicus]MBB5019020.1 ABC-type branched-subunit amino acid transport system substrate-binding protein [Chitinivorax tropicus]